MPPSNLWKKVLFLHSGSWHSMLGCWLQRPQAVKSFPKEVPCMILMLYFQKASSSAAFYHAIFLFSWGSWQGEKVARSDLDMQPCFCMCSNSRARNTTIQWGLALGWTPLCPGKILFFSWKVLLGLFFWHTWPQTWAQWSWRNVIMQWLLHCVQMVVTTFNTTLPAAERYASGGPSSVLNVYCILLFQQLFPPKQQV